MRRSARENAVPALMALVGAGTLAWLGLYGFAWNDYDNEARPAVEALLHGHVLSFLQLLPAYGGSLVERAPFALLPGLWNGGSLAVYRSLAAPCLLASVVLAVWLASLMRAGGHGRLARGVVIALCAANPIALLALEVGHPEELLGACLCVMAVLTAARGKPLAAGALLGLAVANKYWAVLAIPPVLLALDSRQRMRCGAAAAAACGAALVPLLLAGGGAFTTRAGEAASAPASSIFQPWQLWWFAGHHGALVHGLFGAAKPGYRVGPAWVARVSHPAVVLGGLAVGATLWRRRLTLREALLALALAMLLRCLLDSWDTAYYTLPFLLSLLAWEASEPARQPARGGRAPIDSLAATVLVWISFHWLPEHVSPDAQAALFSAWTLPLAFALGLGLRRRAVVDATGQPQGTTVRSLVKPVSTSREPSRMTTRSSILTPRTPGR